MKQFPKVGDKIRAKKIFPEWYYPHYTCMVERINKNLEPEKEYTVSKIEVYSSWVAVWLEEFSLEYNDFFHLSCFE